MFREGLDLQRAELEAQKLIEKERFEAELALRRAQEMALKGTWSMLTINLGALKVSKT